MIVGIRRLRELHSLSHALCIILETLRELRSASCDSVHICTKEIHYHIFVSPEEADCQGADFYLLPNMAIKVDVNFNSKVILSEKLKTKLGVSFLVSCPMGLPIEPSFPSRSSKSSAI